MGQEDAYKMMMGFVNAGVRCQMQRTIDGNWDVVLDDRRLAGPRTLRTLAAGRAAWKALRAQGVIAA
jgi:hypothetical protein